jgi:predicted small lipoprotein YifL
MKFLPILFSCLTALLLTACGQVGPLYLPNQKPPIYVPPPHTDKHSDQTEQ